MDDLAARPPTGSTLLRLRGRDALDVLHRISSQALLDLEAGEARATLFCDFRGRLLHRCWVARTSNGVVWLVRDDASGDSLLAHLERHLFREDLATDDLGHEWAVRATERVAMDDAPAAGALLERNGVPTRIVDRHGFALLVEPAPGRPTDPVLEEKRIRAGRPRHGHEIMQDFNPYEVGLASEVHLSKGCYTGQEALQRLVTYKSVKRRLCLVEGQGPVPAVPLDLSAKAQRAGRLTSACETGNGWVGLAVLKNEIVTASDLESVAERRITTIQAFAQTEALGHG